MLIDCPAAKDAPSGNDKQVQISEEEKSFQKQRDLNDTFADDIVEIEGNENTSVYENNGISEFSHNEKDGIELMMPQEIDRDSDKYYEFVDIISAITDMYNSTAGYEMIWHERNEFITDCLLVFFRQKESSYFDIEKIFPFITICSSNDGCLKIYNWWDNAMEKYKGYNSIIEYVSVDEKTFFTSKLDDYSVEYTNIVKLKDSVYLLTGNTDAGNGIDETRFLTIEIKGHGIQLYNAFNKEALVVYSIDAIGYSRLKLYGSVYDRLVKCVLYGDEAPIIIEFTKIIVNDEIKMKDAKGELAAGYYLRDEDYILEKIILRFDGLEFAGDYEQLKTTSRMEALIENLETLGLSKKRNSFISDE
jgi:hypothetical protein